MRYFIDTEHHDDGGSVELISLGIVAEDGRELYVTSSEFEHSRASPWPYRTRPPAPSRPTRPCLAFEDPNTFGRPGVRPRCPGVLVRPPVSRSTNTWYNHSALALSAWLTDIREGPWYRLMSWLGLSTDRRTTEAWNWIFGELSRRREGVWLKIHLRGGSATYLGAFGTNSLVSSDIRVRDLYLERKWDLDEDGLPLPDRVPNRGVWIAGQDISAIEFYPDPEKQEA